MKILIAGDTYIINSNAELHSDKQLLAQLRNQIYNKYDYDLFVVNSECVFSNVDFDKSKIGPKLRSNSDFISVLSGLGVACVNLANNHIFDCGSDGLIETMEALRKARIQYFGAGLNHSMASKPVEINHKQTKLILHGYCDHEHGIASKILPGANGFKFEQFYNNIQSYKSEKYFNIVLLHDGIEHYENPSPELQEVCRQMIDSGADVVICQHSHIVGGCENYKNGKIYYGQGNFLFDNPKKNKTSWNVGFLIGIDTVTKSFIEFPFEQTNPGIHFLAGKQLLAFNEKFSYLSRIVKNEQLLNEKWLEFCQSKSHVYLLILKGITFIPFKIFKIIPLHKLLYSKRSLYIIMNVIRSRAHREVIITLLKSILK